MPTLLVVDDEQNVLYSLQRSLQSDTLEVLTAQTAKQGIELVKNKQPDAVILDIRLPDMSGLDAFNHIRAHDPRLPVILITAFTTTETAIEAMKRGAFEYLLKPVDFHQLQKIVKKAISLSRMRHVPAIFDKMEPADERADRIIGRSSAMQEVFKAVGKSAPQDVTVLILGESGTGKELIARAIYHHSQRAQETFLAINCAAIPETLLESELFGHERGAFTSADRRRIGKFEQAHGGTIFLDEIGDMSGPTQAKFLRLLQEQRFERLGSNETIQTNVRVIAATNQDLEKLVKEGKFREDLYYRLNVFTIYLPPMRERMEDLPLLLEHFVKLYNVELNKQIRTIAPETLQSLQDYHWPGNVRELQSAVKHAMVQSTGDILMPDSLPRHLLAEETPSLAHQASTAGSSKPEAPAKDDLKPDAPAKDDLKPEAPAKEQSLDVVQMVRELLEKEESDIYRKVNSAVDRVVLEEVLRYTSGNQVQASEILGISRSTLRSKLQTLNLAIEKQVLSDTDQNG